MVQKMFYIYWKLSGFIYGHYSWTTDDVVVRVKRETIQYREIGTDQNFKLNNPSVFVNIFEFKTKKKYK